MARAALEDDAIVDRLINGMEAALRRVDAAQGSQVRLPKAELDLLDCFGRLRDIMMAALQGGFADRSGLQRLFGGDCFRISRTLVILEERAPNLTPASANDQRVKTGLNACCSVEQVLGDLGLGLRLVEARNRAKRELGLAGCAYEPRTALAFADNASTAAAAAATKSTECVANGEVALIAAQPDNDYEDQRLDAQERDVSQESTFPRDAESLKPPAPEQLDEEDTQDLSNAQGLIVRPDMDVSEVPAKAVEPLSAVKSVEKSVSLSSPDSPQNHGINVAEPSPEPPPAEPARDTSVPVLITENCPADDLGDGFCLGDDSGVAEEDVLSLEPTFPADASRDAAAEEMDIPLRLAVQTIEAPTADVPTPKLETVKHACGGNSDAAAKPVRKVKARKSIKTIVKADTPDAASCHSGPVPAEESTVTDDERGVDRFDFSSPRLEAPEAPDESQTVILSPVSPLQSSLFVAALSVEGSDNIVQNEAGVVQAAGRRGTHESSLVVQNELATALEEKPFDHKDLLSEDRQVLSRRLFVHYVGACGTGLSVARFRRFLRDGGLLAEAPESGEVGGEAAAMMGSGGWDLLSDMLRNGRLTPSKAGGSEVSSDAGGASSVASSGTASPPTRGSVAKRGSVPFDFSMADRIQAALGEPSASASSTASPSTPRQPPKSPVSMGGFAGMPTLRPFKEPPISKVADADLMLIKAAGTKGTEQQNSAKLITVDAFVACLVNIARACYPAAAAQGDAMALHRLSLDVLEPLGARLPNADAVQNGVTLMASDADLSALLQRNRSGLVSLFNHYAADKYSKKAYWTPQAISRLAFEGNLVAELSRAVMHQLYCEVTSWEANARRGADGKLFFEGFLLLLVVVSERVHKTMRDTPRDRLAALLIRLSSASVEGSKELRKLTTQLRSNLGFAPVDRTAVARRSHTTADAVSRRSLTPSGLRRQSEARDSVSKETVRLGTTATASRNPFGTQRRGSSLVMTRK